MAPLLPPCERLSRRENNWSVRNTSAPKLNRKATKGKKRPAHGAHATIHHLGRNGTKAIHLTHLQEQPLRANKEHNHAHQDADQ